MTRWQLVCVAVALGLLCVPARPDEPKKEAPDPAAALINALVEVREANTWYTGSLSCWSFVPLERRETHLFGQRPHAEPDAVQSLVRLGPKAVPALLKHLGDDRKTKIRIDPEFGNIFMTPDRGESAASASVNEYAVRVGDICYVALGQIVNRPYVVVWYEPTAIYNVVSVPHCKRLRADLLKEWGGLTAEKHRESLVKDLDSDSEGVRPGASLRLWYYYPEAHGPAALKQLARPTYDVFAAHRLVRDELYPAKTAKDRDALVGAVVKKHGAIARDGIVWHLFGDLDTQEADEQGRVAPKLNPRYKARECLVEVFGYPAKVKSKDRPKVEPLSATAQARFAKTLLFDRGEKLDKAVRDILAKTDDNFMAEGCLNRLVGRGYDADIEAYLTRRLPKLDERNRNTLKKYEAKLGWTRLHAAVDLDVPELIEVALKDAPDVNARGKDGRTALHLAAGDGKLGSVALLLSAKADPNVKDANNRTPLDLAKEQKHAAVVELLGGAK